MGLRLHVSWIFQQRFSLILFVKNSFFLPWLLGITLQEETEFLRISVDLLM